MKDLVRIVEFKLVLLVGVVGIVLFLLLFFYVKDLARLVEFKLILLVGLVGI